MTIVATVLIAVVMLIHVYIFLLETVLFHGRGRRVFGLGAEEARILAPAMSNQGCYNGFLAVALAVGLLHPDGEIARAFQVYGLLCVAMAGIWGAATVQRRILYVQTLPALAALAAVWMA